MDFRLIDDFHYLPAFWTQLRRNCFDRECYGYLDGHSRFNKCMYLPTETDSQQQCSSCILRQVPCISQQKRADAEYRKASRKQRVYNSLYIGML